VRLCLIGDPVPDSPSAAMHTAGLAAWGMQGSYELRAVSPGALDSFVDSLRGGAYHGCNVTIPHKRSFAALCDRLEGDAASIAAVNTVVCEHGEIIGCNTDAEGFRRALLQHGVRPAGGALVLGAGGAGAAAALALRRLGAGSIVMASRQERPVTALRERCTELHDLRAVPWRRDTLKPGASDAAIVVNATPLGVAELPLDVRWLQSSCTVADVRYRPLPNDLVLAAQQRGLHAFDGAEMLLQQAMLSFSRWTARDAPEPAMRAALAAALHA
jgi:shikimate dehydrogenase